MTTEYVCRARRAGPVLFGSDGGPLVDEHGFTRRGPDFECTNRVVLEDDDAPYWIRCHQCRIEAQRLEDAERKRIAEELRAAPAIIAAHGAKVQGGFDGVAIPQKRWRGWRDRQPKKNPVTIRRVGE